MNNQNLNFFIKETDILKTEIDTLDISGGEHASFSDHFGLKRIAAHYWKIAPSLRTSLPHAESLEEEFVYIISGEIDLWFNGKIKTMRKGDCIGFPAGTGDGHTFINNSSNDVEIFVSGDRTKNENQCYFHLEPNLKDELGSFWWSECPQKKLGIHDGQSGEYSTELISNDIYTFNAFDNFTQDSFSYPGDSETFSNGICLSRKFNMKSVAVWIERMPASKRSSWPHAHSVEEEFVYVLEGRPTVWLNEKEYEIDEGTAVDFKAGSGVAHTLINQTDEFIYYLCVGECEPENDKIYYPLHPKRNEEMKEKGLLWESRPTL